LFFLSFFSSKKINESIVGTIKLAMHVPPTGETACLSDSLDLHSSKTMYKETFEPLRSDNERLYLPAIFNGNDIN
jgi:hypothetical protein